MASAESSMLTPSPDPGYRAISRKLASPSRFARSSRRSSRASATDGRGSVPKWAACQNCYVNRCCMSCRFARLLWPCGLLECLEKVHVGLPPYPRYVLHEPLKRRCRPFPPLSGNARCQPRRGGIGTEASIVISPASDRPAVATTCPACTISRRSTRSRLGSNRTRALTFTVPGAVSATSSPGKE